MGQIDIGFVECRLANARLVLHGSRDYYVVLVPTGGLLARAHVSEHGHRATGTCIGLGEVHEVDCVC